MGLITPASRVMFNGPAERWVDTLTTLYTDYQMNTFIFWPSGDRERQSRIFTDGNVRGSKPLRCPLTWDFWEARPAGLEPATYRWSLRRNGSSRRWPRHGRPVAKPSRYR